MNAQYIGKEANKDGSFKYWFNVDGKEIGVTEGGENGGAYEDREGNDAATNDNIFLVFEITDEMRDEVISLETNSKAKLDGIFSELCAMHSEIMASYDRGMPVSSELREKYDALEAEYRKITSEM